MVEENEMKELQWKYLRKWKECYISKVQYEFNTQYAASILFDILETKLNLHQSKLFLSLKKLNSQKIMIGNVKKEFKVKGKYYIK